MKQTQKQTWIVTPKDGDAYFSESPEASWPRMPERRSPQVLPNAVPAIVAVWRKDVVMSRTFAVVSIAAGPALIVESTHSTVAAAEAAREGLTVQKPGHSQVGLRSPGHVRVLRTSQLGKLIETDAPVGCYTTVA